MKTKNKKNSFSEMRTAILNKRYLLKNNQGKVTETEGQMYHRVANTIAAIESIYGASTVRL